MKGYGLFTGNPYGGHEQSGLGRAGGPRVVLR